MMRTGLIVTAVVFAVAVVSYGASGDQGTADQMFDGAHLYHVSCAGCHGGAGEGVTLFGPPLAGDAFVTSSGDDVVGNVIQMGRKYRAKLYPAYPGMPTFQFIRGGELEALVDHLKGPLQGAANKPAPKP